MSKLLDGKRVAAKLKKNLIRKFGCGVNGLAAILVGRNPASILYLKKKAAMAKELGVEFSVHQFGADASETAIIRRIQSLNNDRKVGGIIVQLPLPKKFNSVRIVNSIAPAKDVDGMTDSNIANGVVLPATAAGILELLAEYEIATKHKKIVLLGFSRLLNVPLSIYFGRRGNSVVVLQKDTQDMNQLKQADIVISATGTPRLIKGNLIKEGAVVIDAGIARVRGKIVGDADIKSVSRKAGYLSPVPGGVGPMTVISLFANLLSLKKSASES